MKAYQFLSTVYGEDAPGFLALWTRQNKATTWVPASQLQEAARLAEHLATISDVYVGVALQNRAAAFARWREENPAESKAPTTRGYSATAVALPGFWADVDIKHPAHKNSDLPPSEAAALALIKEFPLSPTFIVHSGHGLQAWWLFRELWVFDNETEQREAQTLARRFLAMLQVKATAHGWQIDPTADLARLLRIPNTWNRKSTPVPVRVIEFNDACRYNPSDFEPYLFEVTPGGTLQTDWRGPTGAVVPVLKHCRFIQHCRDNATTLSEPEWYAMVANLARLDGGKEAIHALSTPYPRYTCGETEQKIAHAMKAAGPHTCNYIQQALGFTGCPPHGCGVKAPAGLGVSSRAQLFVKAREKHAAAVEQAARRRAEALARAQQIRARLSGQEGGAAHGHI